MKNKSKIKKSKPSGFNDGKTHLNLLKRFKNWGKVFTSPALLLVADMQLNNGDTELHVVEVRRDSFKLFGKRYIVNSEYLQYNRTLKMHVAKYHESLSLPIHQHINANNVKESIKEAVKNTPKEADVITNLDPVILEALVTSTIVQKVFAGAEMQDLFGLLKLLSIIILLVTSITGIIVIGTSGIF